MRLQLSEAILLGRTIETPGRPSRFDCCALGLAMAAVGVQRRDRNAPTAERLWPWLKERVFFNRAKWEDKPDLQICTELGSLGHGEYLDATQAISVCYFAVVNGAATLEQLSGWVRSIEPPEEPEVTHTESTEAVAV